MPAIDKHPNFVKADFEISRGFPQPFGATLMRDGINFSLYAPYAKFVSLVLFEKCHTKILVEFPLDDRINKTGNVWHVLVKGLNSGIRYGFRVTCDKEYNVLCNENIILLDPYARATCGGKVWGDPLTIKRDKKDHTFRLSIIADNEFDWEFDEHPRIPLKDSIFYELHVRGYTSHPSAGVKNCGTFLGLTEKIPYLISLGITAVELMPVTDFDETYPNSLNPETGENLRNFWGYDPISFFAPKASYAKSANADNPVKEFKKMVKAFHEAGIEVILDMVFNHTAEADEHGPIYHFKGLATDIYYLQDPKSGTFLNYSGCGNTMNCNHPIVRDMILDSLRYWVTEMHVDGFRFDLASILGRGRDGSVLANPPLIERIAEDPILANTKLIAEAWDAAGLYQVGDFPHFQRWMEWNGKFRDDVRRFVRGDSGMIGVIATRLAGSSDLYQDDGREPFHSVNFVTCHDGFTLNDLVSFNEKHNLPNGEGNRDGSDDNLSSNYGAEGETQDKSILELRKKQMRNFASILLLSQGVPMLLAGDELGRTQQGNNNPYCQDNEISWVDWSLQETNSELLRFYRLLIAFRREQPALRRSNFEVSKIEGQPEMRWRAPSGNEPGWSDGSRSLGLHYTTPALANDLFIILNMGEGEEQYILPARSEPHRWFMKLDTSRPSPAEINEAGQEQLLGNQHHMLVSGRSVVVLISK